MYFQETAASYLGVPISVALQDDWSSLDVHPYVPIPLDLHLQGLSLIYLQGFGAAGKGPQLVVLLNFHPVNRTNSGDGGVGCNHSGVGLDLGTDGRDGGALLAAVDGIRDVLELLV